MDKPYLVNVDPFSRRRQLKNLGARDQDSCCQENRHMCRCASLLTRQGSVNSQNALKTPGKQNRRHGQVWNKTNRNRHQECNNAELNTVQLDETVGCDKEATYKHAEPHKQAMHLHKRNLRRPQGRESQPHETSRRSCLYQKPCRSSRGRRRQRTQHSEITRDTPITTRGTRITTLRDQLDPEEAGCNGARRTTKPGTEGEAKPRSAVKQEIIRVGNGYLKVVDDLELTHSPRILGIDDKLLSKTICVARNAVPSFKSKPHSIRTLGGNQMQGSRKPFNVSKFQNAKKKLQNSNFQNSNPEKQTTQRW